MDKARIFGVPRVPDGMIARDALLQRIGTSPLTVIRGPGGAGKTVLMAQWAARQTEAGVWLTVEPDIGNRAAFWNAVAESSFLPGLDSFTHFEDGADPQALLSSLLRSFRALTNPFVLVVDDVHELSDPDILDDLIAVLHACPAVLAVFGTRTRSELEAPRRRLTLDISMIGPDELVLSADDVRSIVGQDGSRYGTTSEMLEASGGNPLLLRAILAGSAVGGATKTSANVTVRDYLRGLFAERGNDLAEFSAVTAIPDDIDAALAASLTSLPLDNVEMLFSSLETEGLVMRRDALEGVRFRYHPLVREVLRYELRTNDPDGFRGASLLASASAEVRGLFLPALRHAVEADDYSRASDVCLHGGFSLIRSRGAAAIIQQVPLRHVARLPFLAVVLGLAANARGDRWKALQLLTLALGASRAGRGRQRVAERIGLALIETVILRITGRATDSVAPARRMLALLGEAPPVELEEINDQIGSYRLQAALSLFRAGHLPEAQAAAEEVGVSAHALADEKPESLGAASLVAAVDAVLGECPMTAATLAVIENSSYSIDLLDGYVGSLAHLARGILRLEAMDPDAAADALDPFVSRKNLEHGTLFAATRALVDLWRGMPNAGLRALDDRERTDRSRARISPEDRLVVAVARVLLSAAIGQMGAAYEALRGIDRSSPAAAILRAQLYLLEQRPDLVIEQLGEHVMPAEPRLQGAAEILLACASLLRGDEMVAEVALRRFFGILRVNGTLSPVLLIPREHRPMLEEFAERIGAKDETMARLRSVPAPFKTTVPLAALTPREAEVLEQLRGTASLTEIAATLHVSSNTVKSQVRTLYRKLGVSHRDGAVRAAYLQGLLFEEPQAPHGLNRG